MVLFRRRGRGVASPTLLAYLPAVLGGGDDGSDDRDGAGGQRLLDETRDLLAEARRITDGSLGPAAGRAAEPSPTILGLYDELRMRLDRVDDRRLTALLHRITRNVARLNQLAREVERVRRLREALGRL